ncbi:MAG: nucleotide-diphospho-sugar transferase [Sphingomonas bacterium]|nr:hypothetical protein [Sphingomonas bacterium]MDB5690307.1 nucleotide-diphospho-sugar transferase [Sphingomonas bacterium]
MTGPPAPAAPAQAGASGRGRIVCVAENRAWCEPGVRLLIASLARHSPDLAVHLFFPSPSPALLAFLRGYPLVAVNQHPLHGAWHSYDIKPTAVRTLLTAGYDDVLWIDSDIIVTRDIRPLFAGLPPELIVATEEALCSNHGDGDALRTRLWGMPVGRKLGCTVNTGVIRLTTDHLPLVAEWARLLGSGLYREAQKKPWNQRPAHLLGDQEVFTALLGSTGFTRFPVRLLRRGADIVQFFGSTGYTVRERLRHLHRPPAFIHAQGAKPWAGAAILGSSATARFLRAYADLSPYVAAARAYRGVLADDAWTMPRTSAARLFTVLAGGRGPLVGLPHALIADSLFAAKRLVRR